MAPKSCFYCGHVHKDQGRIFRCRRCQWWCCVEQIERVKGANFPMHKGCGGDVEPEAACTHG
jgi:hypothetical protein